MRAVLRQAIALRRGENLSPAGAQNGHILHHALAADAEMRGDFAALHGPRGGAHPFDDPPAALVAKIEAEMRRSLALYGPGSMWS